MRLDIIVNRERAEMRLAECRRCDELRVICGVEQCRICWCFVGIKARVAIADCPLKKWIDADKSANRG